MLKNKIFRFIKNRYAPRGAYISFAQAGEDLLIKRACRTEKPTYMDIGAHHPIFGNNTYLFYKNGGVLVEPNPKLAKIIKAKRPKDTCIMAGVGAHDGEALFYSFERDTRSTFSKEQALEWQNKSGQKPDISTVKIVSLTTLLKDFTPDILSIDAEGLDYTILKNYNWIKKPKVICVEKGEHIQAFLISKGYQLFAQTEANVIFILCAE